VWLLLSPGTSETSLYVADLGPVALGAVATGAAAAAARGQRSDPRVARAWWFIALALALRTAADAVWSGLELVAHTSPFPSVADIGYSLFYPAVLVGFVSLPTARRTAREWLRLTLDAGIVVLAGVVAVWYFVLGPTIHAIDAWSTTVALNVGYPLGDMLLVFGLASTLLRLADRSRPRPLQCLVVATSAFVIGDLTFGRLTLSDAYTGTGWPDVFWTIGLAAFAVAADLQRNQLPRITRNRFAESMHTASQRVSVAPYIAVAVSALLLLRVVYHEPFYPTFGVVLAALGVMSLVVLRQIAALRDNHSLLAAYHHLATVDHLTGLSTRQQLLDSAAVAIEHCQLDGTPVSVLMVDVDHFKSINDTYGHEVGDQALQHIARICRQHSREADAMFGRYGGDEIVAVLFDADATVAGLVANRISSVVAEAPLTVDDDRHVALSLSIGLASAPPIAPNLTELLRAADRALYLAKQRGRNQVASL
jgi:diguanylate cyclase (GGDEF)-like protein